MNTSLPISVPEVAALSTFGRLVDERGRETSAELQRTLVPPLSYRGARIEAHGQCLPMEDVGGDLVDLVEDGDDVIAYVADVSGHGLQAGILMGMVKTAVRYGLLLGQPLAKMLEDVNRVLRPLKEQHMFATLAALRFNDTNEVEYASAGHVPLLHYRKRNGDVVRHFAPQFPLGLLAGATYTSTRIAYEPGDIFALVTDGVVEVGEDPDADAGFQRLTEILGGNAERPLEEIVEQVHAEVARHGAQRDDQTVLLLRAAGERETSCSEMSAAWDGERVGLTELLEARWQKMLEVLASEIQDDERSDDKAS
jgi:serine phosphatase RsbU (regulator of sigma subunit)